MLFKKFAGIDVFDIEMAENDPDELVDIIAALHQSRPLAVSIWKISKHPNVFTSSASCRRVRIPVFHDDQHGTSIMVGRRCSTD